MAVDLLCTALMAVNLLHAVSMGADLPCAVLMVVDLLRAALMSTYGALF